MKKLARPLLILMSLIFLSGGCGMMALSEYITPADLDQDAIAYAHKADVAQLADYDGYPNLAKAKKLKKDVDAAHQTTQLDLQQQIEGDNLEYSIHTDSVQANLANAIKREESIFGEGGLLSTGLALAGMGGFTGLLGLMRKRPGDMTSDEVENAVARATGQTKSELEARNRQLVQVVKGIEAFKQTLGTNTNILATLHQTLSAVQDTDTKLAVKAAKIGG